MKSIPNPIRSFRAVCTLIAGVLLLQLIACGSDPISTEEYLEKVLPRASQMENAQKSFAVSIQESLEISRPGSLKDPEYIEVIATTSLMATDLQNSADELKKILEESSAPKNCQNFNTALLKVTEIVSKISQLYIDGLDTMLATIEEPSPAWQFEVAKLIQQSDQESAELSKAAPDCLGTN